MDEFNYIRSNAGGELAKFLDYITCVEHVHDCLEGALTFRRTCSYAYMIDNVRRALLSGGNSFADNLHRSFSSLLARCTSETRTNCWNDAIHL